MTAKRLGPEKASDGTFSSGLDYWTNEEGWSAADGVASNDGSEGSLYQDAGLIEGHTYRTVYDIVSYEDAFARIQLGGTAGDGVREDGGVGQDIVAGANGRIEFTGLGYVGGIANVSVREILS